ncbi:MAG: PilN domain-containing protein, partial [Planctomycetota bacterium]
DPRLEMMMSNTPGKATSSFLPEDYLNRLAARRSSLICLFLFVVIMLAVVGAFFATNRQWTIVKAEQQQINAEFVEEARRIEQLNELENQKAHLVAKAELAAALVERVPRSVLLAELINRMPDVVNLEQIELKSVKQRQAIPVTTAGANAKSANVQSLSSGPGGPTKAEQAEERVVQAPTYDVTVSVIGIAPTHQHVADFMSNLKQCPLFENVELKYSKAKKKDKEEVNEFKFEAKVAAEADVKNFEPLRLRRTLRNPLDGEIEIDMFDPEFMQIDLNR